MMRTFEFSRFYMTSACRLHKLAVKSHGHIQFAYREAVGPTHVVICNKEPIVTSKVCP